MHAAPRLFRATLALGAGALLVACGGGGGGTDAPNQPPVATITAPLPGSTFQAGNTLSFTGSATDTEDGTLAGAQLTWWANLHHDDHTHPLQLETTGGSGSVTIPTRGETSDNIFYRFHLRARDSAGQVVTVTRDVLPRKARVTLATEPPGLQLTLDGQAVTAPSTFTGVVGIQRDLNAPDQPGARAFCRFQSWSQGGAATQTIATPATDTTYTATFTCSDVVVNVPPAVALTAPATATVGTAVALAATAADSDGSVVRVDIFDGSTLIGSDTTEPFGMSWTPATAGTRSLTARATDDSGATTTSAAATVTVSPAAGPDTTPPTAVLTAPANLADAITGTLTLTATAADAVGVAGVEFQIDGAAIGSEDGTEDISAPYSASVDTTQYASGQHVVRARARDAAGNRSAWATATVRFGGSRGVAAGFTKNEAWVSGLSAATAMAQASDGRLFVAQQGGALRVVKNGALLATPFVNLAVDSSGERGLIGVVLHPAFASNGFVYVYHTRINGSARNNRISRYTASGDVADGSVAPLTLDLPNLSGATNHNGGAMKFGSDGRLYVAVGDNADSSKPQNLGDVFGKMLRFNDDLSIPADNPFHATQTGLARAVWAYGLRNPFTFAVQPGTGRMHINDVGQNTWEEVNLGAAGANYGWPGSEGPDNVAGSIVAPLFAYKHSAAAPAGSGPGGFFTGFAIAGGAFYPAAGPFPAALRGTYFFADYVSRFIGVVDSANGHAAYAFGNVADNPVDLLVGADGALYVLTRSSITRLSVP